MCFECHAKMHYLKKYLIYNLYDPNGSYSELLQTTANFLSDFNHTFKGECQKCL